MINKYIRKTLVVIPFVPLVFISSCNDNNVNHLKEIDKLKKQKEKENTYITEYHLSHPKIYLKLNFDRAKDLPNFNKFQLKKEEFVLNYSKNETNIIRFNSPFFKGVSLFELLRDNTILIFDNEKNSNQFKYNFFEYKKIPIGKDLLTNQDRFFYRVNVLITLNKPNSKGRVSNLYFDIYNTKIGRNSGQLCHFGHCHNI